MMHNLVELWALLALFLCKIFDQVQGNEWSADVGYLSSKVCRCGLFNSDSGLFCLMAEVCNFLKEQTVDKKMSWIKSRNVPLSIFG